MNHGKGDWRDESDERPASLPVRVPGAFQALIDGAAGSPAARALSLQVYPSSDEDRAREGDLADPLGEARFLVSDRLVHQYHNRVLLLTTGTCLGYCRYCFRRGFTAREAGFIGDDELSCVIDYLRRTPNVREILVSGGDPLSAGEDRLVGLLQAIRLARPDILIRLCTRANVFAPELFSPSLVASLRTLRPLWVIPHVNHPAELGPAQLASFRGLIDSGIPIQSQTVLLRGINDQASVLAELFHRLTLEGIKPGYLFQCDLARGVSSYRVPLSQGLALWRELRHLLSGLSLPEYAVDLPGGGGKFPLSVLALSDSIESTNTNGYISIRGPDGKVYNYPLN